MKNSPHQLMFAVASLIVCGALEEVFPKFLGVGFPFLMMAAFSFARTTLRPLIAVGIMAIVAGGFEDGLCSLPVAITPIYLIALVFLSRRFDIVDIVASLAYPGYQIWLAIWGCGAEGSVFLSVLLALPIGALTYFAVMGASVVIERKAALNEEG